MPPRSADHSGTDVPGIDYLSQARELSPVLAVAADEIEFRGSCPSTSSPRNARRLRSLMTASFAKSESKTRLPSLGAALLLSC
jgi:hypothetical protein